MNISSTSSASTAAYSTVSSNNNDDVTQLQKKRQAYKNYEKLAKVKMMKRQNSKKLKNYNRRYSRLT